MVHAVQRCVGCSRCSSCSSASITTWILVPPSSVRLPSTPARLSKMAAVSPSQMIRGQIIVGNRNDGVKNVIKIVDGKLETDHLHDVNNIECSPRSSGCAQQHLDPTTREKRDFLGEKDNLGIKDEKTASKNNRVRFSDTSEDSESRNNVASVRKISETQVPASFESKKRTQNTRDLPLANHDSKPVVSPSKSDTTDGDDDDDDEEEEDDEERYIGLCSRCVMLRGQKNFCPLCQGCYEDDDYDARMMECGRCKEWIHAHCEGLSNEHYQILSCLPDSVDYTCRLCLGPNNGSYLGSIMAELKVGMGLVLDKLMASRYAKHLVRRDFYRSRLSSSSGAKKVSSHLQECSGGGSGKKTSFRSDGDTSTKRAFSDLARNGGASKDVLSEDVSRHVSTRGRTILSSASVEPKAIDSSSAKNGEDGIKNGIAAGEQSCSLKIDSSSNSAKTCAISTSKTVGLLESSSSQGEMATANSCNNSQGVTHKTLTSENCVTEVLTVDKPNTRTTRSTSQKPKQSTSDNVMENKSPSDQSGLGQTLSKDSFVSKSSSLPPIRSCSVRLEDICKSKENDNTSLPTVPCEPQIEETVVSSPADFGLEHKPELSSKVSSVNIEMESESECAMEEIQADVSKIVDSLEDGSSSAAATSSPTTISLSPSTNQVAVSECNNAAVSKTAKNPARTVKVDLPSKISKDIDDDLVSSDDSSFCDSDSDLESIIEDPDEPKDLLTVKEHLAEHRYDSVLQFHVDVCRVIEAGKFFSRGQTKNILSLYAKHMKDCFPWFDLHGVNIFDLIDKYHPFPVPHADHNYAVSAPPSKLQSSPGPKNSPAKLDSISPCKSRLPMIPHKMEPLVPKGIRKCVLCNVIADGDPNIEGRLLYLGQDEWLHVNCGLWSSEVYEEDDGRLQKVYEATSRGRMIKCNDCQERGATVGCCHRNCSATFHFKCAMQVGSQFLEDKRMFCPAHRSRDDMVDEMVSFDVNRCVYVDMSSQKRKWKPVQGSKVNITIGSLTIHSLGRILPELDSYEALIPVDLTFSRLYWSTVDPRKRVRYVCRTKRIVPAEATNVPRSLEHPHFVIDHSRDAASVARDTQQMNDWFRRLEEQEVAQVSRQTNIIPPHLCPLYREILARDGRLRAQRVPFARQNFSSKSKVEDNFSQVAKDCLDDILEKVCKSVDEESLFLENEVPGIVNSVDNELISMVLNDLDGCDSGLPQSAIHSRLVSPIDLAFLSNLSPEREQVCSDQSRISLTQRSDDRTQNANFCSNDNRGNLIVAKHFTDPNIGIRVPEAGLYMATESSSSFVRDLNVAMSRCGVLENFQNKSAPAGALSAESIHRPASVHGDPGSKSCPGTSSSSGFVSTSSELPLLNQVVVSGVSYDQEAEKFFANAGVDGRILSEMQFHPYTAPGNNTSSIPAFCKKTAPDEAAEDAQFAESVGEGCSSDISSGPTTNFHISHENSEACGVPSLNMTTSVVSTCASSADRIFNSPVGCVSSSGYQSTMSAEGTSKIDLQFVPTANCGQSTDLLSVSTAHSEQSTGLQSVLTTDCEQLTGLQSVSTTDFGKSTDVQSIPPTHGAPSDLQSVVTGGSVSPAEQVSTRGALPSQNSELLQKVSEARAYNDPVAVEGSYDNLIVARDHAQNSTCDRSEQHLDVKVLSDKLLDNTTTSPTISTDTKQLTDKQTENASPPNSCSFPVCSKKQVCRVLPMVNSRRNSSESATASDQNSGATLEVLDRRQSKKICMKRNYKTVIKKYPLRSNLRSNKKPYQTVKIEINETIEIPEGTDKEAANMMQKSVKRKWNTVVESDEGEEEEEDEEDADENRSEGSKNGVKRPGDTSCVRVTRGRSAARAKRARGNSYCSTSRDNAAVSKKVVKFSDDRNDITVSIVNNNLCKFSKSRGLHNYRHKTLLQVDGAADFSSGSDDEDQRSPIYSVSNPSSLAPRTSIPGAAGGSYARPVHVSHPTACAGASVIQLSTTVNPNHQSTSNPNQLTTSANADRSSSGFGHASSAINASFLSSASSHLPTVKKIHAELCPVSLSSDLSPGRASQQSALALRIKEQSLAHSTIGEQGPYKCHKCRRLYRTYESYERHVESCTFEIDSSSSSEDDVDDTSLLPSSVCVDMNRSIKSQLNSLLPVPKSALPSPKDAVFNDKDVVGSQTLMIHDSRHGKLTLASNSSVRLSSLPGGSAERTLPQTPASVINTALEGDKRLPSSQTVIVGHSIASSVQSLKEPQPKKMKISAPNVSGSLTESVKVGSSSSNAIVVTSTSNFSGLLKKSYTQRRYTNTKLVKGTRGYQVKKNSPSFFTSSSNPPVPQVVEGAVRLPQVSTSGGQKPSQLPTSSTPQVAFVISESSSVSGAQIPSFQSAPSLPHVVGGTTVQLQPVLASPAIRSVQPAALGSIQRPDLDASQNRITFHTSHGQPIQISIPAAYATPSSSANVLDLTGGSQNDTGNYTFNCTQLLNSANRTPQILTSSAYSSLTNPANSNTNLSLNVVSASSNISAAPPGFAVQYVSSYGDLIPTMQGHLVAGYQGGSVVVQQPVLQQQLVQPLATHQVLPSGIVQQTMMSHGGIVQPALMQPQVVSAAPVVVPQVVNSNITYTINSPKTFVINQPVVQQQHQPSVHVLQQSQALALPSQAPETSTPTYTIASSATSFGKQRPQLQASVNRFKSVIVENQHTSNFVKANTMLQPDQKRVLSGSVHNSSLPVSSIRTISLSVQKSSILDSRPKTSSTNHFSTLHSLTPRHQSVAQCGIGRLPRPGAGMIRHRSPFGPNASVVRNVATVAPAIINSPVFSSSGGSSSKGPLDSEKLEDRDDAAAEGLDEFDGERAGEKPRPTYSYRDAMNRPQFQKKKTRPEVFLKELQNPQQTSFIPKQKEFARPKEKKQDFKENSRPLDVVSEMEESLMTQSYKLVLKRDSSQDCGFNVLPIRGLSPELADHQVKELRIKAKVSLGPKRKKLSLPLKDKEVFLAPKDVTHDGLVNEQTANLTPPSQNQTSLPDDASLFDKPKTVNSSASSASAEPCIVFELTSEDGFKVESRHLSEVWQTVFDAVTAARASLKMGTHLTDSSRCVTAVPGVCYCSARCVLLQCQVCVTAVPGVCYCSARLHHPMSTSPSPPHVYSLTLYVYSFLTPHVCSSLSSPMSAPPSPMSAPPSPMSAPPSPPPCVARCGAGGPHGKSGLHMLGLTHNAVQYLLEQLPGANDCQKYSFQFHRRHREEGSDTGSPSGCARTESFKSRSPYDLFSWLASQHRKLPETDVLTPQEEIQLCTRRATSLELPMAMRYRHLRDTAREAVGVFRSCIHGRGLFCKRDIDAGEMVIEYAGQMIRSSLCDIREKSYESKGIGCYMFRIDDDTVVDATMHGNAARFINHSCDPNCYSRVVDILGKKHIIIFALRRIIRGEELTYDYKFPIEDDKIPCTCGARRSGVGKVIDIDPWGSRPELKGSINLWGRKDIRIYMVEAGFSHANAILTKQRNRLNLENRGDLRLKLTNFKPNINSLAAAHQAHPSH
ncbi:FY-rich N-terminal [Trinorchestia longiramus]|nr:FY-rich N-terminal [Trinorchestia longiramus]